MYKSIATALIAAASTLGAGVAHAGNISWSIGINTPVIGTVISNVPVYSGERSYYLGPSQYSEPAYYSEPVYHRAPAYAPAAVYVQAPPVYLRSAGPVYRSGPRVGYSSPHIAYGRPVPVAYPGHYPGRQHGQPQWNDQRGRHD